MNNKYPAAGQMEISVNSARTLSIYMVPGIGRNYIYSPKPLIHTHFYIEFDVVTLDDANIFLNALMAR
jgi:hypothetical protein